MSRQSPRRNGRNQGLKVKHVLQISVLLGVGVWLLYQLQQPFDGKSVVEVDKFSDHVSGNINLGRKDLKNDMRTEDTEVEEEKRVVDHSDEELNSEDEHKLEDHEVQEVASTVEDTGDEKFNDEGDNKIEASANNEIEDVKPENEDGEKMEENGSKDDNEGKEKEVEDIQILGAKENVGESEFSDEKMSNETAAEETKDQEIKSDVSSKSQERNDIEQVKISGEEAEGGNKNLTSSSDDQAENRSNETDEGATDLRVTGEAEKEKHDPDSSYGSDGVNEQQNKLEVNSEMNNSIQPEDIASNETIPEQSEKSNPSDETSGLDDTNDTHNDTPLTESTSEKSSIHEMDELQSATNNDSETDTSESHTDDIQIESSVNSTLQEEKDARIDIDTLPDSGNGDNSNQDAIAK